MDSRQLRAFVAVFEERSITRAASRLHLTQPTLSVTIRQLEEALGVALFAREARGVAVTEAARRLYPQAQRLLAQMARLASQFAAPDDCLPLTLGVEADVGDARVVALLAHVRARLPHLLLTVVPGCEGDLRLASEELRCEDELFLPLWEERFAIAMRADAAQAGAPALAPGQAAALDWICCPQHPSHPRLLAWLDGDTAALQASHVAGTLSLARDLVAAGHGVALLPPGLLTPALRAVPLAGDAPTRRVGLCYAANAREEQAVASLLDSIADLAAGAPLAG